MKWIETNGRAPRNKDAFWHVEFRNGMRSLRPYNGRQMDWSHRDPSHPCYHWDVIAVARAAE